MKKNHIIFYSSSSFICARNDNNPKFETTGNYDTNKFSQSMTYWLRPICSYCIWRQEPAYYQQQADYKIDIELDDKKQN
jgi:hypothetical protein